MTTKYPHEVGVAEEFTPESLRDLPGLPNPPKFYLRWGSPRDKEHMRWLLDDEGCVVHSEHAMREEIVKGLPMILGRDDGIIWEATVREWWDAADEFQKEHALTDPKDMPEWTYEGEDRIEAVLEEVAREWAPYRRMNAQNNQFRRMQGHAINAAIIEGFENVDIELPKKRGRYLTLDVAMLIADAIDKLRLTHNPGSDARPAQQLGRECVTRMFSTKEALGNSVSPAPSEATPVASQTGEA